MFDEASYSFEVKDDAAVGVAVGAVTATDPNEDPVTYSITAGNESGKFAIAGSTGAITTTGTLDHDAIPSYTLTVQASDGGSHTTTATVEITVTDAGPNFAPSAHRAQRHPGRRRVHPQLGAADRRQQLRGTVVLFSLRGS